MSPARHIDWSLRDYGLPPLVWEHSDTLAYRRETGDDGVLCEHEWGVVQMSKANDSNRGTLEWTTGGDPAAKVLGQKVEQGQFCLHCHAWRGSLGLEPTPDLFVLHLVEVMREVWRVLRDDGTLFLNLGDSYVSSSIDTLPPKNLVGIPWRVAFALQADGWILRSDIIWAKGLSFCPTYSGSCMPESVRDRPTKGHEYVFLLTKKPRYFYDQEAVREAQSANSHGGTLQKRIDGNTRKIKQLQSTDSSTLGGVANDYSPAGRNLRTVWAINPSSYKEAHFATFPPALVEPCINAGTSERGVCPACGASWVRVVERKQFGKADSDTKFDNTMQGGPLARSRQAYRQHGMEGPPNAVTTGWRPMCACGRQDAPYQPIPATVLDPFGGAGTVGLVADRLGRDARLIDLNGEYVQMAYDRLVGDSPMFADVKLALPIDRSTEHV